MQKKTQWNKVIRSILLLIVLAISVYQFIQSNIKNTVETPSNEVVETNTNQEVEYGQSYTSKEEVALYLIEFEELPPNYITKEEAYDLGWEPSKQNLWEVTDHMSIGGDRFMNREGNLPKNTYYEADIDYQGKGRNAKRLVYTKDGTIYYTSDHYESFQEVYP